MQFGLVNFNWVIIIHCHAMKDLSDVIPTTVHQTSLAAIQTLHKHRMQNKINSTFALDRTP